MKAKKTVAKKKITKKSKSITKKELKPNAVIEDSFEYDCPTVMATAEDVYVAGVEKGGFESFSYQKRAEGDVKDQDKTYLIVIIVLLVITLAYRMFV